MTTSREAQMRSKTFRMGVPASIDGVTGVAYAPPIEIHKPDPNPPSPLPCGVAGIPLHFTVDNAGALALVTSDRPSSARSEWVDRVVCPSMPRRGAPISASSTVGRYECL